MFAAFLFFFRKKIGLLCFLRALILYCKYATFSHSHQTHSLSECLQWQCRKCLYRIYGFICQTWLRLNPCQNTNIFYFFFYMKSSIASFFFQWGISFLLPETTTKKKTFIQNGKHKHAIESIACRMMLTQRAKTKLNKQMKIKIDFMEVQKRFPWNWAVYL